MVLRFKKDKIDKHKKGGVVYKIHANTAEVCMWETGRQFRVRMAEHRKETENFLDRNFARATSRASASEYFKSLTERVPEQSRGLESKRKRK